MGLKRFLLDRRVCKFMLVFYFIVAMIPSTGEASLIESRISTGEQMSERAEKIESVRKALEHKVVAQRLADYGLTQEEVMARMNTWMISNCISLRHFPTKSAAEQSGLSSGHFW